MNTQNLRWCLAFAVLMAGTSAAQEPQPLDGYKTLDQATPGKILASPNRTAQTGYLGVSLLRDPKGQLVVDELQPESPAATAGVKKGDLVTRIGDQVVRSPEAFREWVQTRGPGESVKLALQREGKPLEVTAKLAATSRPMSVGSTSTGRAYLGMTSGDFKEGEGLKVDMVLNGSPADTAGLKSGDRITKLDGKEVARSAALLDLLAEKKPGDMLAFSVKREGKDIEMKATLGSDRGRIGETGGFPLWKKASFNLAVIMVEFTDVQFSERNSALEWSRTFFSNKDKGGSLNDYFTEQSHGKFKLEGKVFDRVAVGKKRGEYIQGSGTSNKTAPLSEALDKLLARDGKDALKGFDGLAFVYAGDPVRTNRGAVYYPHAGSVQHQNKRWPYLLNAEGGAKMTTISGFAKEMGLVLGLPELAARTENVGSEGLGSWCALSNVNGNGKPQHYNAWAKEKLGWITPTLIDPSIKQKLILSPIEDSPKECLKVLVRADGSEYFLLENRKKKGFDADLPGEGLLIWRVVNDRPILEESHGIEGPSGPTVHLDSVPYPSPANNAFTPDTTPSSRSPLGGGFPVHLTEIRRLPDGRITLQVGYEYR